MVFSYRRPNHLKVVLDALSQGPLAPKTNVTVYIDGAKNASDLKLVKLTFLESKKRRRFQKLSIIKRKENLGLAKSIVFGVNEILQVSDRVIVLEDDTVPMQGFLEYMNKGLEKYAKMKKVYQIAGFSPPRLKTSRKVCFSYLTSSWGWGTWKRAWHKFQMNVKIPESLRRNVVKFNYEDSYPFYKLLEDAENEKSQSWAIRWYFVCFQRNKWVSYPPLSYIRNIGFDGSGEHLAFQNHQTLTNPVAPSKLYWPKKICEDKNLKNDLKKYLTEIKQPLNKWWASSAVKLIRLCIMKSLR